MKTYHYDIHGIIKVKSNIEIVPSFFKVRYVDDADLVIHMGNFEFKPKDATDFLYLESKRLGFLSSKFLVNNLEGKTRICVLCPRHRLLKIVRISLKDLFGSIIQLKLLQRNAALIHAACLAHEDEGILLAAPPETGKTSTAFTLAHSGWDFLADDMVIISDGKAYCYPSPITVEMHHIRAYNVNLKPLQWLEYWTRKCLLGIPFLGQFFFYNYLSIDVFRLPASTIASSIRRRATIRTIFFLEEGSEECVKEIDSELALKKLLAVGRMHRRLYENEVLQLYAYQNPNFDLEKYITIQKDIYEKLIANASSYLVECKDKKWNKLISKVSC